MAPPDLSRFDVHGLDDVALEALDDDTADDVHHVDAYTPAPGVTGYETDPVTGQQAIDRDVTSPRDFRRVMAGLRARIADAVAAYELDPYVDPAASLESAQADAVALGAGPALAEAPAAS